MFLNMIVGTVEIARAHLADQNNNNDTALKLRFNDEGAFDTCLTPESQVSGQYETLTVNILNILLGHCLYVL